MFSQLSSIWLLLQIKVLLSNVGFAMTLYYISRSNVNWYQIALKISFGLNFSDLALRTRQLVSKGFAVALSKSYVIFKISK